MAPTGSRAGVDDGKRLAALALAAGRFAIGAGIWLAPRTTMKALGFDPPASPQALAVARIAGTRDLVLGAWQASALDDRTRLARATAAVAACDAGDTLAFGLLLRAGQRRGGVRGLAGALPATLVGVALARRLNSGLPPP